MREVEVDYDESKIVPDAYAPWYEQFMQLSQSNREKIAKEAMRRIENEKPEVAYFLEKVGYELVGIQPRVEYALITETKGDPIDVTWIHSFSMPTLLFWCKQIKAGLFVNANLDYNDTVLNKVSGNKRQSLRGFTG